MTEVDALDELTGESSIVISVCPPAAAGDVAEAVHGTGFSGLFLDANAVAPSTVRTVCAPFDHAVDGGIVGPPVLRAGTTRLHVSGERAGEIVQLFAGSDLEVRVVEGAVGAASAVKMCFAAWTKGTSALLFAIAALAKAEGVGPALDGEWATSMPDLLDRVGRSPASIGPKAWRFAPEMHEIASTFEANDLPGGFHVAAADIYERMAPLKGTGPETGDAAELSQVLALLLER